MSHNLAEIDALMQKAAATLQGKSEGAIVAMCERVLDLLVGVGLVMLNVSINPMQVGIHYDNRYGLGVKVDYMHGLAAKIFRSGFRWSACTDAICSEEDDRGSTGNFTTKLQTRTNKLGKQTSRDIHYGSLACSHLNQWLVAVLCAAESDKAEMSVDGRFSANKVRAKQPEIAEAMEKGLRWTIIKAEAVKRWPIITKLVQGARQIAGQIHNGETHFELLVAIQEMANDIADPQTGAIDWTAVQKAASATEHRFIDDVPYLCTIVQLYGGGNDGQFLRNFTAFVQAAVPDNRRVPGLLWKALAHLKLDAAAMSPYVIWAILKTEASCPKECVMNGVTGFLTAGSIGLLASKEKASMIKANRMMEQLHEAADRVDIDSTMRAMIVDKADIAIVRLLLGKDVKDCKSMEQAAGQGMKSLIETFPELGLLDNPWASFLTDTQPAPERTEMACGSGLVQYGAAGSNAYRLSCAQSGYSIGALVEAKAAPDTIFKIIDMQEAVRLREISSITGNFVDKKVLVIEYEKFLDRYSMKNKIELMAAWPGNTIVGSSKLRSSLMVAHCMIFINSLLDQHGEPEVQIRSKPTQGVFAKTAHKPRSLTIVPCTLSIKEIDDHEGFQFVCVSASKRYSLLAPAKNSQVVSVAFCVRSSHKSEECNCALKKIKSESGDYPSIIECTVITNTKKIAAGDELVLHREPVVKKVVEKSPLVNLNTAVAFKKPRLA